MTHSLPPQDPGLPDEKLPSETELAALYRQLPQSQPNPALDAAVLRAAAQALQTAEDESPTLQRERRKAARERGDWVHPKQNASTPVVLPHAGGSRRRPRWLIALSSAATLVLAAGLAWHMRQAPAPESGSTKAASGAPAQATAAAPRGAPASAAMPPAEPATRLLSEPPRQPPPRMIVTQSRTPTTTAWRKAAADKSAARASGEGYVTGGLVRSTLAASAAPPTILQESISDSAANAAKPAMAGEVTAPNASDTPAQELHKIQQLFAQHRDDEARRRLTAFQHAHPHWELPPGLRTQLRQP